MNRPEDVAEACATLLRREHAVPVGTGSWAIHLLLKAFAPEGRVGRIALPAFLCHSPLAAVLAAGWSPWFCDVDVDTGVPSPGEWERALAAGVDAVLFVHLFGSGVDPGDLPDRCGQLGVLMIEDACQAFGAHVGAVPCGSFGDVSVLSFGHTKQIDAGGGAVVLSDSADLVDAMLAAERDAPEHVTADWEEAQSAYSSEFYRRKDAWLTEGKHVFAGLAESYVPLLSRAWRGDCARAMEGIANLGWIASERRRKAAIYDSILLPAGVQPVGTREGSAPWRYSFRMPGMNLPDQQALSSRVRERGVHVSNWYLPLPWLLQDQPPGDWPGSETLSTSVFQLWLDEATDDEHVVRAAEIMSESIR